MQRENGKYRDTNKGPPKGLAQDNTVFSLTPSEGGATAKGNESGVVDKKKRTLPIQPGGKNTFSEFISKQRSSRKELGIEAKKGPFKAVHPTKEDVYPPGNDNNIFTSGGAVADCVLTKNHQAKKSVRSTDISKANQSVKKQHVKESKIVQGASFADGSMPEKRVKEDREEKAFQPEPDRNLQTNLKLDKEKDIQSRERQVHLTLEQKEINTELLHISVNQANVGYHKLNTEDEMDQEPIPNNLAIVQKINDRSSPTNEEQCETDHVGEETERHQALGKLKKPVPQGNNGGAMDNNTGSENSDSESDDEEYFCIILKYGRKKNGELKEESLVAKPEECIKWRFAFYCPQITKRITLSLNEQLKSNLEIRGKILLFSDTLSNSVKLKPCVRQAINQAVENVKISKFTLHSDVAKDIQKAIRLLKTKPANPFREKDAYVRITTESENISCYLVTLHAVADVSYKYIKQIVEERNNAKSIESKVNDCGGENAQTMDENEVVKSETANAVRMQHVNRRTTCPTDPLIHGEAHESSAKIKDTKQEIINAKKVIQFKLHCKQWKTFPPLLLRNIEETNDVLVNLPKDNEPDYIMLVGTEEHVALANDAINAMMTYGTASGSSSRLLQGENDNSFMRCKVEGENDVLTSTEGAATRDHDENYRPIQWSISEDYIVNLTKKFTRGDVVFVKLCSEVNDIKEDKSSTLLSVQFPWPSTCKMHEKDSKQKEHKQFQRLFSIADSSKKQEIYISLDNTKSLIQSRSAFVEGLMLAFSGFVKRSPIFCSTITIHTSHDADYQKFETIINRIFKDKPKVIGATVTHTINVNVIKGQLANQKVDVLVNTTSTNLDFSQGAVSKSLLKVSGKGMQKEAKRKYPSGITLGEVADTEGYQLNCKKVFHCTLDTWNCHSEEKKTNCIQKLRLNMTICLEKMDMGKCKTIAFPALGTGILKYPLEVVAEEMFTAVDEYASEHTDTSITDVYFVIYDKDVESYKVFCNKQSQRQRKQISTVTAAQCSNNTSASYVAANKLNEDKENAGYHVKDKVDMTRLKLSTHPEIQQIAQNTSGAIPEQVNPSNPDMDISNTDHYQQPPMIGTGSHTHADNIITRNENEAREQAGQQLEDKVGKTGSFSRNIASNQEGLKRAQDTGAIPKITPKPPIPTPRSIVSNSVPNQPPHKDRQDTDIPANNEDSKTEARESAGQQLEDKVGKTRSLSMNVTRNQDTGAKPKQPMPTPRNIVSSSAPNHSTHKDRRDSADNQDTSSSQKLNRYPLDNFLDGCSTSVELLQKDNVDPLDDKQKTKLKNQLEKNFLDCKVSLGGSISISATMLILEEIRLKLLQMLPDISKDEDSDSSDAGFDDSSDENNDELNYRETFKSIQSNSSKSISICDVRHEVFMALQHFYKADWDITVGMRVAIDYKNNGIVLRSENHNKVLMASVWVREALQDLEGFYFDEIVVDNTSGVGTSADKLDHKDVLKALDEVKAQSNWRDVQVYLHDRVVKVAGFSCEIVMEFKECVKRKISGHTPTPRRHRQLNEITSGKLTEDRALENTNTSVIKFKQQASIRTLNKTPKSAEKYTTKEGLVVYVYKQSLLRLDVDCIVNAANDTLQHGGGIAKAIADAAGKELDFESKEYIKKKGKLRVGNCCNTTAGKLPYQCVIHTVGPRKCDYSKNQTEQLQSDLCSAVFVCLNEARNYGLTTIGIPSISSGIFGVPKRTCALQYCKAVLDYSKLFGNDILKQIHFVDINDRMIELIQTTFAALINQDKAAEKRLSEKRYKKRNNTNSKQTESSENIYPQQKWERRNKQSVCVFELSGYFKVVVKSGDITQFSTGAITCPQDSELRNESGVAKAILENDRKFEETIKQNRKRSGHSFSLGEVICTKAGNLSCSNIYNVIVPSLRRREHAKYSDELKMCYSQLFQVANKQGIRKLAFPLMGAGKRGGKPEFLSAILLESIIEVCNSQTKVDTLKELHVINKSKDATKSVIKRLTEYIDGEKGAYNDEIKAASDNTISSSSENEEFKTPPDSSHVCPNENRRIEDTDEIQPRSMKDNPLSALEQTYCDENQTGHTNLGGKHVDNDNTKSIAIETCPICMDKLDNPKVLHKCGHKFCTECIEQYFKVKPVCPNCFTVYGVLTGYQPKGTMYQSVIDLNLPGYDRYKTIKINYSFHDGIQTEDHPKPGQPYYGTKRIAYLPDCNEGRKVLKLLRIAFDRKLVFTIGRSVTTGQEDVVTWNDIHHKTHTHGGSSNFGYPDTGYLQRVQDELAAKGVTED